MFRTLLLTLALTGLALAGCTEAPAEDVPTATPTPTPTPAPTPEPEEEEDLPPQARLLVNGASHPDGLSLPGAQEVTFEGGRSVDRDGAGLVFAWLLDAEDKGGAPSFDAFLDNGTHVVSLVVTDATGQSDSASVTVTINPVETEEEPASEPRVYFFDGGDDPADWTFAAFPVVETIVGAEVDELPETIALTDVPYAYNAWHVSNASARTGNESWTMVHESNDPLPAEAPLPVGYGDHANVSMVSPPIALDGASAVLSFAAWGDGEANDVDGMWWSISLDDGGNWTDLGFHSGPVEEWTETVHDLGDHLGQTIRLRFLFKSDAFCSAWTPVPAETEFCAPNGGQYLGYYLDDIRVAEV